MKVSKKIRIIIFSFLTIFFLIVMLQVNVSATNAENCEKNSKSIILPKDWIDIGFEIEVNNNNIFIDMCEIEVLRVCDLDNHTIGYFFENILLPSSYKINHFCVKWVMENNYVLELQIEGVYSKEKVNYDAKTKIYGTEFSNVRTIINTSTEGCDLLSNSYMFNKSVYTKEKSEIMPYYDFSNIAYGDTDEYLDGYTHPIIYIDPSEFLENDGIINIIPMNYFFTTGEKKEQGKEYGYYMDTFFKKHPYYNIDSYVSLVYIYDIELAYPDLHGNEQNISLDETKFIIKPLFVYFYQGYVRSNTAHWNALGLNPNMYKMVVPCTEYNKDVFLNVENITVMNDSSNFTNVYDSISFEFNAEFYPSNFKKDLTFLIVKGVEQVLKLFPHGKNPAKLVEFAWQIYKQTLPTDDELYVQIKQILDENNYNISLGDLKSALISVPITYNYNAEFLKYNIKDYAYSYEYTFTMEPNYEEDKEDFYNLYIADIVSIYSKDGNKMVFITEIESGNEYGVQRRKQNDASYILLDAEKSIIEKIEVANTFATLVFKTNEPGYYSIELSNPQNNVIKGEIYNTVGNEVARTNDSVRGKNKIIIHMSDRYNIRGEKIGEIKTGWMRYFLRFQFDGTDIGDINIKIKKINVENETSLSKSFFFDEYDSIQYVIFKPTNTKEYTFYTSSYIDPSIFIYRNEMTKSHKYNGTVDIDDSRHNLPLYFEDDSIENDPSEMYPDLNCNFKYELIKDVVYVIKIKNNPSWGTGQVTLSIK